VPNDAAPLHRVPSRLSEELTMADPSGSGDKPRPIAQTKRTGQKRSLERGKSTRKKNPGKRAHSGGS
jgi:hypothetical protein